MTDDWQPDQDTEEVHAHVEQEEGVAAPPSTIVGHFDEGPVGLGLDGSTPFEGGIEGRLTHAGGYRETDRRNKDWEPYVEVDQPVQRVEGEMA